jgi:hypothetical protein
LREQVLVRARLLLSQRRLDRREFFHRAEEAKRRVEDDGVEQPEHGGMDGRRERRRQRDRHQHGADQHDPGEDSRVATPALSRAAEGTAAIERRQADRSGEIGVLREEEASRARRLTGRGATRIPRL